MSHNAYYNRIAERASAKAYIEQSEAADRIRERTAQSSFLLTTARAWLADYRAGREIAKPRTSFNWAPRWPFNANIIGIDNGKTIEGDYTIVANTHAAGRASGGERSTSVEESKETAGAGSGDAQEPWPEEADFETPF